MNGTKQILNICYLLYSNLALFFFIPLCEMDSLVYVSQSWSLMAIAMLTFSHIPVLKNSYPTNIVLIPKHPEFPLARSYRPQIPNRAD